MSDPVAHPRVAGSGALLAALVAVGCSTPPAPGVVFEEATGERVPGVAQVAFMDNGNAGLGAAIGDVDGDGRPDLYLGGGGLFLNRPDAAGFRFEPAAGSPPGDFERFGAAFGDYDNDGDLDLALCGTGGVQLWANDGSGDFTQVTQTAGVAGAADDLTMSVAWGDIDGDGWLDLAVANYGFPSSVDRKQPSHLYLNQRDGTFAELIGPLSDLPVRAWVAAFADFDGDGRLDLYFGDDADIAFPDPTIPRRDIVLLNRGLDTSGALQLVESSAALGLDTPRSTMGIAIGNADRGSGWDVLITDIEATWLLRSASGGLPFADITGESGIDMSAREGESWWQWGCAFSDLDGDGWEDALVGQSGFYPNQPEADFNSPILLYNHGDGFTQIRHRLAKSLQSRAVVLADLDGDGDDDVVVGPYYTPFRFFTNAGSGRFLRVKLEATVSAPDAAGAVVVARVDGIEQKRMMVSGGQPHSTSEPAVSFGLGDATTAELHITWPSGAVQQVPVAAQGTRVITEPRWIEIDNPRPSADGSTQVTVRVDAAAAGLGGPGSTVTWTAPGTSLQAMCDQDGVATLVLAPRITPGSVQGTLSIDGQSVPAHPTLDYQ